MTRQDVIIIGAFHEIIELAEENNYNIVGLIDNERKSNYFGYDILCNDENAKLLSKNIKLLITPDNPKVRRKLYYYYNNIGFSFTTLISNDSKISKSSIIDCGTVVQFGCHISSNARIGKFVKINTYANIMHDAIIDDFTTIAPNAVVLGNVKIGKNCYIGSNATILPSINICDDVIIGAGSVVTKDIVSDGIYAGIPSKLL